MSGSFIDGITAALAAGHRDKALSLARAAAAGHDPDALLLLASWQLVGYLVPRDLLTARHTLRAAADLGLTEAALIDVALTGNGGWGKEDWPAALQLLTELSRHNPLAKAHLQLLAEMDIDAAGNPRRPIRKQRVSASPEAYRLPGFCSPQECRHIAEAAIPVMEPSQITDPATGAIREHPIRTSHSAFIGPTRESLPIRAINKRIAFASGTTASQGEPLVVLHYAPGQQYRPHLDTLPGATNQRMWTLLIYLNDDYLGGETDFPGSGLTVKGRLGDALLFRNLDISGQPEPRSRHAGLPIKSGRKWLATRWIRSDPLDVWTASS